VGGELASQFRLRADAPRCLSDLSANAGTGGIAYVRFGLGCTLVGGELASQFRLRADAPRCLSDLSANAGTGGIAYVRFGLAGGRRSQEYTYRDHRQAQRGDQYGPCRSPDEGTDRRLRLLVTHNTPPPLAAKQATSVIPIVFATAGDPVGTGVVESLARPGGNVTGLSSQHPDVSGKRLELLRELVPGLRRLAFLAEPGNPFSALELSEVRTAARTLGLEVMPVEIQRGGLQEGRKNANIESVWDSSGESRSKSTLGGTSCRLSLPQFFSSLSFLERYSTCLTMELR